MKIWELTEEIRKDEIKLQSLNEMILRQIDCVFCDNVIITLKSFRKEYIELKQKIDAARIHLNELKRDGKNRTNRTIGMAR